MLVISRDPAEWRIQIQSIRKIRGALSIGSNSSLHAERTSEHQPVFLAVILGGGMIVPISDHSKILRNISLLMFAAILALAINSIEDAAAASTRWHRLIFPHLGPFTGLAPLFITGILPGLPFAFVAWYVWRSSRQVGVLYRVGIGCLVVVLAIVSFKDIAWLLWFAISVMRTGGRL